MMPYGYNELNQCNLHIMDMRQWMVKPNDDMPCPQLKLKKCHFCDEKGMVERLIMMHDDDNDILLELFPLS